MGLSVVRFAVTIVLVVVTLVIMSLESAVRTNVTQDIEGRNVIKVRKSVNVNFITMLIVFFFFKSLYPENSTVSKEENIA